MVDLAGDHPVSRPAISRHLRVLSDAGLVEAADHGRERYYSLRTDPLDEVLDLIRDLRPATAPIAHRDLDALATEVRRTSRDRRRAPLVRAATTSEEETA